MLPPFQSQLPFPVEIPVQALGAALMPSGSGQSVHLMSRFGRLQEFCHRRRIFLRDVLVLACANIGGLLKRA